MKKAITDKKKIDLSGYNGLSDFFLRAPDNLKKEVLAEAAHEANKEQMKVFKQATQKLAVGA
jgi:hypothetical protein